MIFKLKYIFRNKTTKKMPDVYGKYFDKLNNLDFCCKLIVNFEDCMRPFHNGKQDFDTNYKFCVKKFKKDFEICSFKPEDIY